MLVVKYEKTGGAEFIPHLDTLRHLQKTIVRSRVAVEYSKGFNPHMLIFMSAPIGVGLTSECEFFFLETSVSAGEFLNKFNAFCPGGFKATFATEVTKNPNLQAIIDGAEYFIECDITDETVKEILAAKEYFVKDKRGEIKEVRSRILNLKRGDNGLIATLSFGNDTLRADIFAESLKEKYSLNYGDVVKKRCFIRGVVAEEYIKEKFGV